MLSEINAALLQSNEARLTGISKKTSRCGSGGRALHLFEKPEPSLEKSRVRAGVLLDQRSGTSVEFAIPVKR
jgi:hypothetical protein